MTDHEPASDLLLGNSGTWSALRYRDYRRYWLGSLASVGGAQALTIAQGWVVYDLTESALMLGYLGLATAIPSILMTPLGCLLYTSPSPRDRQKSRMPSSA